MERIKVLMLKKERIFVLIQFAVLIGVATVTPLFKQQIITGAIINATLFIATMSLGIRGAILVGIVPSLISLSIGLLPPVLAPMVPFIITGNAILIVVFNYLKPSCAKASAGEGKSYWLSVVFAASLKFIFLLGTSTVIINLFLKKEIASSMAMMMSWPQLLTALLGGIVAYLFFKKDNAS